MRKYLEKVQDFRFLPVFVIVSMAVGIAIGSKIRQSKWKTTLISLPGTSAQEYYTRLIFPRTPSGHSGF